MKQRIITFFSMLLLALALTFSTATETQAQCAMCKMGAESNLKRGGEAASGLNAGILYMLATPYLIIGTIGAVWYINRKKEEDLEME